MLGSKLRYVYFQATALVGYRAWICVKDTPGHFIDHLGTAMGEMLDYQMFAFSYYVMIIRGREGACK